MLKRLSDLKVGITIFIALVIFIIFVSIVGTENNVFSRNYDLKVFLTNIEGLANGSMVTLGGMKIGQVKGFEFARINDTNGIIVTMTLRKSYQEMITEKSTASIKTIGMLGDKYIDISIGRVNERKLSDGEFLPVKDVFSLENAANKLQIKLDSTFAIINSSLKDVKEITSSLAAGKGTLGQLITSNSIADNINRTLYNINEISRAIVEKRGTLGMSIYDKRLYENLQEASKNINQLVDSISTGKGTLGKLIKNDSLYTALNSIGMQLDSAVAKLNTNSTVGNLLNSDELYLNILKLIKDFNLLILDFKEHPKKYINVKIF